MSSQSSAEIPCLEDQKSHRNDRFGTYINYGFGVPFSYWKEWDIYPFVHAKYNDLKHELLNNNIYTITLERFNNILDRGKTLHDKISTILGQHGDKNTAFAHNRPHWNGYCRIAPGQQISLHHLLSILFYTDLSALPMKMKIVCRKIDENETIEAVKKRHVEFVNWLKLLTETLIFYGNRLSYSDAPIYHGLTARFLFDQFKAKFHIPTSTTTDRGQAALFAKDDGIILQFGGLEGVGDPYFDTAAISQFSHEKEYLFFKAELNITMLYIATNKFSMAPLSLYQSIINGSLIIDKVLTPKSSDKKKKKKASKRYEKSQTDLNALLDKIDQETPGEDMIESYGLEMLENFIDKNRRIYINHQQIIDKIGSKKLRARFIEQDKQKAFKGYSEKLLESQSYDIITIHEAETHEWTLGQNAFGELMKKHVIVSKVMRFGRTGRQNLVKFYCQIDMRQAEENDENDSKEEAKYGKTCTGRMSLILFGFGKHNPEQKSIIISCDFFCKEMNKYYVRFHTQTLTLGGNKEDTRVTDVFEGANLINAFQKKKKINWIISIRKEAKDMPDMVME